MPGNPELGPLQPGGRRFRRLQLDREAAPRHRQVLHCAAHLAAHILGRLPARCRKLAGCLCEALFSGRLGLAQAIQVRSRRQRRQPGPRV